MYFPNIAFYELFSLQKAVADEIPGIFQLSAEINYISDEALELLAWALDNSLFQILTLNKSEVF